MAEDHAFLWTGEELTEPRQVITIDTLPDGALLAIFDHYIFDIRIEGTQNLKKVQTVWKSLVHVCRRWRSIVFESPRRLDLRIVCTGRTPAKDKLDVWPALPLIVVLNFGDMCSKQTVDNIVAALKCTDRVCQIDIINVDKSESETIWAAMQQPFPELKIMRLYPPNETVLFPDSFLGGSVPRLESLLLGRIAFPGLPKLLLSATQLVDLQICDIPHSGYFPPDAIATVLPTLTCLDSFYLQFKSARSCPDRASRRPPPSTRPVLPVLTNFRFKGVGEYLEDLVIRIDAPQLKSLQITFFNDIAFDTPQLIRFLSQTPKLKELEKASILFWNRSARVKFSSKTFRDWDLDVEISCKGSDWQLSFLEQVCTSCLPPISMLESLFIYEDRRTDWKDNIDNELWVDLLRPFSAVRNLYLSEKLASLVSPALQELVEGRTTAVLPTILPALQNIFVRGLESSVPVQEGIQQFVTARQVAGHPIAVSSWIGYGV